VSNVQQVSFLCCVVLTFFVIQCKFHICEGKLSNPLVIGPVTLGALLVSASVLYAVKKKSKPVWKCFESCRKRVSASIDVGLFLTAISYFQFLSKYDSFTSYWSGYMRAVLGIAGGAQVITEPLGATMGPASCFDRGSFVLWISSQATR
jgi:hypothetical protein